MLFLPVWIDASDEGHEGCWINTSPEVGTIINMKFYFIGTVIPCFSKMLLDLSK